MISIKFQIIFLPHKNYFSLLFPMCSPFIPIDLWFGVRAPRTNGKNYFTFSFGAIRTLFAPRWMLSSTLMPWDDGDPSGITSHGEL